MGADFSKRIEGLRGALRDGHKEQKQALGEQKVAIEAQKVAVKALKTAVEALATAVEAQGRSLEKLERSHLTTVHTLDEGLAEMNESFEKHRENVGTAIQAMWSEMNELKSTVATILTRLDILEKKAS